MEYGTENGAIDLIDVNVTNYIYLFGILKICLTSY